MMEDIDENWEKVASLLRENRNIVIFSGAGISTESGIPDYRTPGGIWSQFEPVMFSDFCSSHDARKEFWRQESLVYPLLEKARPNPAHEAVTDLYREGHVTGVITQNIDGLHQKAGFPGDHLVELHGSPRESVCLRCGAIYPQGEIMGGVLSGETPVPMCRCGGFLKPRIIFFGQPLESSALENALSLARNCDVFFVIGSTLLVTPAAEIPLAALAAGAVLIILNLSGTPCDSLASCLLRGKAGVLLPRIVERMKRGTHAT